MFGPARYLVRAELRRRWPGALAIGVVAAVCGAVVIAAFAAARRGPEAFEEFVDEYSTPDEVVFVFDPSLPDQAVVDAIAAEPDVVAWHLSTYAFAEDNGDGPGDPGFSLGTLRIAGEGRIEAPRILEGRLPDPSAADELAVDEAFVDRSGAAVGDRIEYEIFAADQVDTAFDDVEPAHGTHEFTIVGITRSPSDLAYVNSAQAGTYEERDAEQVTWPAGLWNTLDGDVANYGRGVSFRVRPGADGAAVGDRLVAAFAGAASAEGGSDGGIDFVQIERAIDQQSNALRAFGLFFAVASAVLVVQAIRRHLAGGVVGAAEVETLGAVRSTRPLAGAVWGVVVALVALPVAAFVAIALSRLGTIGVGRQAERTIELRADWVPILCGAGVIAAGLVLAGMLPVRVGAAAADRHRTVAHPGPTTMRMALSLLSTASTRTVRVARFVVLPVAVAGVVGAVVFGASLHQATTEPEAYGWTWDVAAGNCSTTECVEAGAAILDGDPGVAAWTGITYGFGTLDGVDEPLEVDLAGPTEGWAAGRIIAGRAPQDVDEIVLGRGTAAELEATIGDEVGLGLEGGDPVAFTVVGLYEPPSVFKFDQAQDVGAGVLYDGGLRAVPPDFAEVFAEENIAQYFLVDVVPGPEGAAALSRIRAGFSGSVFEAFRPDRLEAAHRVEWIPAMLAALVAALGVGTVVHVGLVIARTARVPLATLRAIGLARGQVRRVLTASIAWLGGVAVVVGGVAGVVGGRAAWGFAADGLGSAAPPEVDVGRVLAALVAVLVVTAGVGGAVALGSVRRSSTVDLRG